VFEAALEVAAVLAATVAVAGAVLAFPPVVAVVPVVAEPVAGAVGSPLPLVAEAMSPMYSLHVSSRPLSEGARAAPVGSSVRQVTQFLMLERYSVCGVSSP